MQKERKRNGKQDKRQKNEVGRDSCRGERA